MGTRFTWTRIQLTSYHDTRLMAHPDGRVLGSPNREAWETWSAEDAGDGAVFLVGAHGLALRSEPNGTVDLTRARLGWERWRIVPSGDDDTWFVRSVEHGLDLCLAPDGRVSTNGNRGHWERFSLAVVRPAMSPHVGKTLRARELAGSRRLSARGGGPSVDHADTTFERWVVEDAGDGLVHLVSEALGSCLARSEGGPSLLGRGPDARWSLDELAPGVVLLSAGVTGERLAIRPDGGLALTRSLGDAARWQLEFATPAHAGRRIHLASSHDTRLAARPDGRVVASRERLAQETWEVVDVGAGEFALRSAHGNWLAARPDGSMFLAGTVGAWERWSWLPRDSGRMLLHSVAHGQQLQATPEGLIRLTPNRDSWERWQVEPLPARFVGRVLVLVRPDGLALGATPEGSVRTTDAQQRHERWQVEDAGEGAVYLVSALGGALSATPDGRLCHVPGRSAAERWQIREVEPGSFRITSRQYGHHLAMRDGVPTSREPSASTLWSIVERPRTTFAAARFLGKRIVLSSSHGTRLAHGARGVTVAGLDDGPSSVWTLSEVPGGFHALVASDGRALCLDDAGNLSLGAAGGAAAHWSVEELSPGVFVLTHWRGRNLQARPDGAVTTHLNTALWEWWRIELAPEAPAWPPIGRRVLLTSHHDTRLSLNPAGEPSTSPNRLSWETFAIEDAGDGDVFLVSYHETLLSAAPDGAVRGTTARTPAERWRLTETRPGHCNLRSVATGRWLRAWPNGQIDTAPAALSFEEWRVDPALIAPLYPSQGEWGKPPASAASLTRRAIAGSPLDVAARTIHALIEAAVLPVLARLQDVFVRDIEDTLAAALSQTQKIAEALQSTASAAAATLLDDLRQSPVIQALADRSVAIASPLGRIELHKRGAALGVHLTVRGPNGARALVGLSNADPLCARVPARMANPTGQALAFVDLQLGRSHVHARARLGAQQLSVSGEHFFKLGDEWMRLRLGVLDPRAHTVEAGLEIGVKLGVDAKLSAEMACRARVQLSTNPAVAAAAVRTLAEALHADAGEEGIRLGDGGTPLQVARALSKALNALAAACTDEEAEQIGKIELAVEGAGKLGVGIADSTLALLSATGSVSHALPFLALARLNVDLLLPVLELGAELGAAVSQLGAGHLAFPDASELPRVADTVARRGREFVGSLGSALAEHLEDATFTVEFQVDALGEKKDGGGGDQADMSFTLFSAGLELPVGAAIVRLVEDPRLVLRAAQAILAVVADLAPQIGRWQRDVPNAPSQPAPIDWHALSLGTDEKTRLAVEAAVAPLARVGLDVPAVPLLKALHQTSADARELLRSAVQSARDGSLRPLHAALERLQTNLGDGAVTLLADAELSLVVGGGLNFNLGLEVDAELGLGASFTAKATPGLLLRLGSVGRLRLGEAEGSIVLAAAGSLAAGVSLGELVEVDAELSLGGQSALFSLELAAWDGDLPPAADTRVAGFEVLDFAGTVAQDGALDGAGELVLPTGGTVPAKFATDAAGRVLRGSWSADLELGEHKLSITRGALDDRGLHARVLLPIAGLRGEFELSLASDGALWIRHGSDLELGGVRIARADLSLMPDGFTGAGKLVIPDLLAADATLRVDRSGDFYARARGTIDMFGRTLTDADLTLGAYDLRDPDIRGTLVQLFPDRQHLLPQDASQRVAFVSGAATLDLLGGRHTFRLRLIPTLGIVEATAASSLTIDGLVLSDARMRLGSGGVTGRGSLKLGGLTLAVDLAIDPHDVVSVTCSQDLWINGINLGRCALRLTGEGFVGTARVWTLFGEASIHVRIPRSGAPSIWV